LIVGYTYERKASDPNATAKALREVLRAVPGYQNATEDFRVSAQHYVRAAGDLDLKDEDAMVELADPILLEKLGELLGHLVAVEKLLKFVEKHNPHDPR
jgi:hypothetical protein